MIGLAQVKMGESLREPNVRRCFKRGSLKKESRTSRPVLPRYWSTWGNLRIPLYNNWNFSLKLMRSKDLRGRSSMLLTSLFHSPIYEWIDCLSLGKRWIKSLSNRSISVERMRWKSGVIIRRWGSCGQYSISGGRPSVWKASFIWPLGPNSLRKWTAGVKVNPLRLKFTQ